MVWENIGAMGGRKLQISNKCFIHRPAKVDTPEVIVL